MTRTTLSAAQSAADKQVTLASIAGLVVGSLILIDGEYQRVTSVPTAATLPVGVFRGVVGSNVVAHPITAGVAYGTPDEFAPRVDLARRRDTRSYSVAGAIDLPTPGNDAVAILNGAVAIAATIANPGKNQDGDILYVVGNGKAAHTLTYTGGLGAGGGALDVLTFATGAQQCVALMAANEIWVPMPSVLAGTLTNITVTAA